MDLIDIILDDLPLEQRLRLCDRLGLDPSAAESDDFTDQVRATGIEVIKAMTAASRMAIREAAGAALQRRVDNASRRLIRHLFD